jgi:hypothetical protein
MLLLFNINSPIYPELLKVPINCPITTRFIRGPSTVKVGYNIMKGAEYSVSLYVNVVLTE